jgi:hypothetical protein
MDDKVRKFFARYEKANAEFDVTEIASLYADVFLFGGSQGFQSIKKDEFVKVLPRRKDFFRSLGLTSSKVERIEASELDSNYMLAKVFWITRGLYKFRFEWRKRFAQAVPSAFSAAVSTCGILRP